MPLIIKTGMNTEYDVARQYAAPNVRVLTGVQTVEDLEKTVPQNCNAIMSFGLCGGLGPAAQIGQAFIYDTIVTPDAKHECDAGWRKRLFGATRYYECRAYSDGSFNTANTIAQRKQLFEQTGCVVIDDESRAVAEFAKARNIAFIGLRVVSDGAEDDLPPAVINALNPDGSSNIMEVVKSVLSGPTQIPALIKTAWNFKISLAELRTAAIAAGPNFQAPTFV